MILLDTNAVLWTLAGSPRAAPLSSQSEGLRLSPVVLLEIRFLQEVGRVKLLPGRGIGEIAVDTR